MARFKLLSDADLLRIDQASRALLWEVGVRFTTKGLSTTMKKPAPTWTGRNAG